MDLKEKLTASFLAFENKVSVDTDSNVHDIRSSAFDHFEQHGFPTKKDEEWKYTSLNSILKHNYNVLPETEVAVEFAKVKLPTIRGDVLVDFDQQEGKHFYLNIVIPGNTTGRVFIPIISEKYDLIMDGKIINAKRKGKYFMVDNVGSGKHSFSIINTVKNLK